MGMDTEALARVIGSRVKQERRNRGWTLDQLAEAAGVSRRMVINVEQGSANPSVGTLLRLSDALGIGLPALVEPPAATTAKLTRSGDGAALWTGDRGGRGMLIAGTESPDVMELWDWTLAVHERHDSEAHTAGTRELLQVQAGSLTITVDEERFDLDVGDALTFHGSVAHSYVNSGDVPARFILAVFEPGVGATHRGQDDHD